MVIDSSASQFSVHPSSSNGGSIKLSLCDYGISWGGIRSLREENMQPLRSSFMPNGISVGSSNIGIATPASTFNDPIADLPDAAAPMQQEFTTTGDFGHSPIDVQTEMAQIFLFSDNCFPSMHHYFQPCKMFFDTICDLFEHMNTKRREHPTAASCDGSQMTTNMKISDTSIGSTYNLSLSVIHDVFHARQGNVKNTEKSVQKS